MIRLLASVVPAAGVNVAVQVMPPSIEASAPRLPLATVRPALVKPGTACEKVIVTSEVSPAARAPSATLMVAVGGVVSIVINIGSEGALGFSPFLVATTVRLWVPSASGALVMVQAPPVATVLPRTVTPSVSNRVMVVPAEAVPLTTGMLALVMRSVFEMPVSLVSDRVGTLGLIAGIVSTATNTPKVAVFGLPAASVKRPEPTVTLEPPGAGCGGVRRAV